jgi:ribosomal protein L40E
MTEILTESFCERCGTRYTFESDRGRKRLTGVRTLSRGLKNFVLSDDTSMDEAMAAARSETEREMTSHQLDAFHKTFTFCMSCRQYTCPNCWNEAEARCLTCAPRPEVAVPQFAEAPAAAATALVADPWGMNGSNGSHLDAGTLDGFDLAEAQAALDLESEDDVDVAARLATLTAMPTAIEAPRPVTADVEPVAEAEAVEVAAEPEVVVEAVVAEPVVEEPVVEESVVEESVAAEPEPRVDVPTESEHVDLADIAAAAIVVDAVTAEPSEGPAAASKPAGRNGALRRRFHPGQNLDAELDAYERDHAAAIVAAAAGAAPIGDATVEPEPVAAAEPEVVAERESVAAVEPGPVAAVEPGVVAQPEVAAESEPIAAPEPIAVAALVTTPEPEPIAEPEPVLVAEPDIAAATVADVAASAPAAVPEATPLDRELAAAALATAALGAGAPASEPEPPAPVADDIVRQPTWRMVAPDSTPDISLLPPVDPPALPAAASAEPAGEPQWPAPRPEYLGSQPAAGLPFLGRPAAPTGGVEAVWAESTRVLSGTTPAAATGVQPCVSCGLSLSATARFCRRCGTAQAR